MKRLCAILAVLALALPVQLLASDLRPGFSLPSSRDRVQAVAPSPSKTPATPAEKAADALNHPETSRRFMKTTRGTDTPAGQTPAKPPASLQ